MEDESLVLEVQEHNTMTHDTKQEFYNNSVKKGRAWDLIANILDADDN